MRARLGEIKFPSMPVIMCALCCAEKAVCRWVHYRQSASSTFRTKTTMGATESQFPWRSRGAGLRPPVWAMLIRLRRMAWNPTLLWTMPPPSPLVLRNNAEAARLKPSQQRMYQHSLSNNNLFCGSVFFFFPSCHFCEFVYFKGSGKKPTVGLWWLRIAYNCILSCCAKLCHSWHIVIFLMATALGEDKEKQQTTNKWGWQAGVLLNHHLYSRSAFFLKVLLCAVTMVTKWECSKCLSFMSILMVILHQCFQESHPLG